MVYRSLILLAWVVIIEREVAAGPERMPR